MSARLGWLPPRWSIGAIGAPLVAPKKTALPLMEKPSRDESDRGECEPIEVMRCKF